MATISIELLAARLAAIAQGQRLTKAEVMREALPGYIGQRAEGQTPSSREFSCGKARQKQSRPGSALEPMGDLVGSLEGPGDLSKNPAYMEGFGEL